MVQLNYSPDDTHNKLVDDQCVGDGGSARDQCAGEVATGTTAPRAQPPPKPCTMPSAPLSLPASPLAVMAQIRCNLELGLAESDKDKG
jgi:hypothetical protein